MTHQNMHRRACNWDRNGWLIGTSRPICRLGRMTTCVEPEWRCTPRHWALPSLECPLPKPLSKSLLDQKKVIQQNVKLWFKRLDYSSIPACLLLFLYVLYYCRVSFEKPLLTLYTNIKRSWRSRSTHQHHFPSITYYFILILYFTIIPLSIWTPR